MAMKKRKMTHKIMVPMETRSSMTGKFWLTHHGTNSQTETIDIKEVYNLCVLSNPKAKY